MAITVNNVQTSTTSTLSYTPSNVADSCLVVFVSSEDVGNNQPITGCTFGATGMTFEIYESSAVSTNANDVAGFYLLSPGTSAQTITVSGGERHGITALTLGGVSALDVSAKDGSNSNRSSTTVGATTTGNAIAISSCSHGTTRTITLSGGMTEAANFAPTSSQAATGYEIITGATTYSHTFTTAASDRFNSASMAFTEAAGGATYTLSVDSGSYTVTGNNVGLLFNRSIAIDTGSYTQTGQDVGLLFNRAIAIDTGSYTYTGNNVDLIYTPISGPTYTIIMDQGSYVLTGQDVGLLFNRSLSVDSGSYALTGGNPNLVYSGDIWAVQSNASTSWSNQADDSTSWTAQTDDPTTWTIQ